MAGRAAARLFAAAALALTVGGSALAATSSPHDLRHRAEAARARAAEARVQEQALIGSVAAQSERIDAVEADLGSLRSQVTALEQELARSRERLRTIEAALAEKTRTLRRAKAELRTAQTRLSRRLVDIYTSGESDEIGVLLGAESLQELIDHLETRERVLDGDATLVAQIDGLRARMTRERARARKLRTKQAAETERVASRTGERRQALATLAARRDALAALRASRQRSLAAVRVDRAEWEAEADAFETESRRLTAVIAAAPPSPAPPSAAGGATSSGGFIWPLRGPVVSPYGQRWGRLHAGIDISAPAGTPIVASAAGQVVYAGSMSGYGLLVVIQHAGGIATAYAHNSSIAVSVGQSVGQGQTISAVGCTGSCQGDHLHFEVRVGGSPVDPMRYL